MRKIAVVTGSRADYGILKPVMTSIRKSPQLKLLTIVTGMHLIKNKGYTIEEVKKDFFVDAEINVEMDNDKEETLIKAFGRGINKLVDVFLKLKPDIVVVLGDRNEALAGAITAAQLNIPVAHIHGGDISQSGTIDESIRFAITNFSHIHFAATKESAERIKKIGEQEGRIYLTGSPAVDAIKSTTYLSRDSIMRNYNLNTSEPFGLLIHNPITIDPKTSLRDLKTELEVLTRMGIQILIVYPNADCGSEEIISAISAYKDNKNIKIYKNIDHSDFLNLLKYAEFLIGNSTTGIIEAPTLKTPVLNIGQRQTGREYFGYIKFLRADKEIIKKELGIILKKNFNFPEDENPYGDGTTAKKIVDVLVNIRLDFSLIKKERCLQ